MSEYPGKYAESQSQTGSSQGQILECQDQPSGLGGIAIAGAGDGNLGERTDRAIGVRGGSSAHVVALDSWGLFVGGILAQLILDSETRLGEAIECLEWYERVKSREQVRLQSLRQLQLDSLEAESDLPASEAD